MHTYIYMFYITSVKVINKVYLKYSLFIKLDLKRSVITQGS